MYTSLNNYIYLHGRGNPEINHHFCKTAREYWRPDDVV